MSEAQPLFWTKSGEEETLCLGYFQHVMGSKDQDLEEQMFSDLWDYGMEIDASISGDESHVICTDGLCISLQSLAFQEKMRKIKEVKLFAAGFITIGE